MPHKFKTDGTPIYISKDVNYKKKTLTLHGFIGHTSNLTSGISADQTNIATELFLSSF